MTARRTRACGQDLRGDASLSNRADAGELSAAERLRVPRQDRRRARRLGATPIARSRSGPTAWPRACARSASGTSIGWPSSPPTPRPCWRRTSECPRPAWCWSPSTSGSNSDEIGYILKHSGAKVLLVDHEFESGREATRPGRAPRDPDRRHGRPPAIPTRTSWLRPRPNPARRGWQDEYETISINYTSGTTGRPKGVMIHHRGAYLNAIGRDHRDRA